MIHPSASRDNRALLVDLHEAGRLALETVEPLQRRPTPLTRDEATWDRIEGMLLGLAIGDALGNTSEALLPAERAARHGEIRDYLPNRHAGGRRVGLPSDDTQLAFWTLERLLEDDGLVPARVARRFTESRIFGIGRTVRAFIRRHKDEALPWHETGVASLGNGALMRIAPVIVPHVPTSLASPWTDAALAAMITHNERGSTAACVAFVQLLWDWVRADMPPRPERWLATFVDRMRQLEGDTRYVSRSPHVAYEGPLWAFVGEQVRRALASGLAVREACDRWYSGAYLLETVPAALYILARHGHDPEEAIVRAVNDTRDNDTIAAIVGALHGRRALPARWIAGLLGRTAEADDGAVFQLVARARERWWDGGMDGVVVD